MDSVYYMKMIAAFIFVIALMYLIGWLARRYGGKQMDIVRLKKDRDSQMRIVDSIVLDYRRRLVIVDYAGKGYMMMLGPQSETVVASDIELDERDKRKND